MHFKVAKYTQIVTTGLQFTASPPNGMGRKAFRSGWKWSAYRTVQGVLA
jgi:hypothetical protein